IVAHFCGLLTSRFQQSPCMFIAVVTHHISERMPLSLRALMVPTPLQKPESEEDHRKPLFYRFVRRHPKVGQPYMLFDGEIVHFDGPALLIPAQDVLGRQREVGAQKILRVFIPMVPLTDADTDRKRHALEWALALPYEVRALPLVCSGQRHALIPLMP